MYVSPVRKLKTATKKITIQIANDNIFIHAQIQKQDYKMYMEYTGCPR